MVAVAGLASFAASDLSDFGERIRGFAHTATSMEDACGRIASLLYEELVDERGAPACALVRVYKTHPYGRLPHDLRAFAGNVLGEVPDDDVRCLTLLATRGALPAWNDRRLSAGHRAIPLPTVGFVEQLPMIAGLVGQLGLSVDEVVRPQQHKLPELSQRSYGVFHVAEAAGSTLLPAQDFVGEHGIRSALGFGGVLFSDDFYAVVLFAREPVSAQVADTIRVLSLAVRVALQPFGRRVFDEPGDGVAAAPQRVA